MARENIAHLKWLRKKLEDTDDDLLKELLHQTIELLMSAEADVRMQSRVPQEVAGAGK